MSAIRLAELARHWLDGFAVEVSGLRLQRPQHPRQRHPVLLGVRPIGKATRADVQQVVNDWAVQVSPSTTVRHYACLRAIFSCTETPKLIVS